VIKISNSMQPQELSN